MHGASVNDVVVTAVTGALVELLARRGETVGELVVSMPMSRRAQGEAGWLGNSTGVVPVRVPAVPDAGSGRPRSSRNGPGTQPGPRWVDRRAHPGVPRPRGRRRLQAFVDHQRLVHTFVTNVRARARGCGWPAQRWSP